MNQRHLLGSYTGRSQAVVNSVTDGYIPVHEAASEQVELDEIFGFLPQRGFHGIMVVPNNSRPKSHTELQKYRGKIVQEEMGMKNERGVRAQRLMYLEKNILLSWNKETLYAGRGELLWPASLLRFMRKNALGM
jgi:hypothetical protein